MTLTAERLRELLHYDQATGVFTWKVRIGTSSVVPGSVAGGIDKGRRRIRIGGRLYFASRLAWLYMTGKWPADQIDHRDLNKSNDAWPNLRPCIQILNRANTTKQCNNTSGYKGVTYRKDCKKWRAQINAYGKKIGLGTFNTPGDAHQAYCRFAERIFGEFARFE